MENNKLWQPIEILDKMSISSCFKTSKLLINKCFLKTIALLLIELSRIPNRDEINLLCARSRQQQIYNVVGLICNSVNSDVPMGKKL